MKRKASAAATQAIAFDREVEIFDSHPFTDIDRAASLAELLALRTGHRDGESELMDSSHAALDRISLQLAAHLQEMREKESAEFLAEFRAEREVSA